MNFFRKLQVEKLTRRMDVDILNLKKQSGTISDAFCSAIVRAAGDNLNNNADTMSVDEDIETATNNEEVNTSKTKAKTAQPIKEDSTNRSKNNKESSEANDQQTVVDQPVDAAMSGGTHIKDENPDGVINLGFGITMDTNAMSEGNKVNPPIVEEMARESERGARSQNAYIDHLESQGYQMPPPAMMFPCNPPMMGFVPQYPYMAQQPQTTPIPQQSIGHGRHKVDNPQPPKPEAKKAEPDNVNVQLDAVKVKVEPPKPPKETPEIINNNLVNPEPIVQMPKFDNSEIISMYDFLGDIERIATECGAQIKMSPRRHLNGEPTGLITCSVYTSNPNVPVEEKCFTIDTGVIIDRRKKVWTGVVTSGYEDLEAYPVDISDKNNHKGKKIINEELFRQLFIGGKNAITQKGMYTRDYKELNKKVALITMPTNNMNKETRHAVTDRLMAAYKAGVFDVALKGNEYARFKFKAYKKETQEFALTTQGVPYRFCEPVRSTNIVEIEFTADGKTTINPINPNI